MAKLDFINPPIVELMARYRKLDGMWQGYACGHMDDAMKAFAVALDVVEKIAADQLAKKDQIVRKSNLRIVESA